MVTVRVHNRGYMLGSMTVTVEDHGTVTVDASAYDIAERRVADAVVRAVLDTFRAPLPEGTYLRATNNRSEPAMLRSRTLRPSRNHVDDSHEAGLSVATGAHYAARGYRYAYLVRGAVCGEGADGEPVLDLATAEPAGKLRAVDAVIAEDRAASDALLAARGWTRDDMADICSKRWTTVEA